MHKAHFLVVLSFLSLCLGADIYLNPEANCSPPTGCSFLAPTTWINGTVPKSSNGDNIFIITNSTNSSATLIIAKDLYTNDSSFLFVLQSLVLQGAELILDFSAAQFEERIQISNGLLTVRNGSTCFSNGFSLYNSSHVHVYDYSLGTTKYPLEIDASSSLNVYNSAGLLINEASIYGSVNFFDSSIATFYNISVFGSLVSTSSGVIKLVEAQILTRTSSIAVLDAAQLVLGPGALLPITSSLRQISGNITLSSNSELLLTNLQSNSTFINPIGQVFATGPANITIQNSSVAIGGAHFSDLSQVSLNLEGMATLYTNELLLGEVKTNPFNGTNANSVLHINTTTVITQNVEFAGQILVSNNSMNFSINDGVILSSSGCVTSYGVVHILGEVVCSAPGSVFISHSPSSLVNLYGKVQASEVLISESRLSAQNATIDATSIMFNNSKLDLVPENTLIISGNVTWSESVISVKLLPTNSTANDLFMIQVHGTADVTSAKLEVNLTVEDGITFARTYNLLNSTTDVKGTLQTPSLDNGGITLEHSSANQIIFSVVPKKHKGSTLPLWAIVVIAVGGALALAGIIVLIVVLRRRKHKYDPA